MPPLRLGLPARLAILGAALLAEKIFLNGFVNFDAAQAAQGLGALLRVAQHWGFRLLVAFAAAMALFTYVRGGENLRAVDALFRAAPLRAGLIVAHLLLVALLAPLSYLLYRYTASDASLALVIVLWSGIGLAALVTALMALAPLPLWREALRRLGIIWPYAALAAVTGTAAMQLAQMLWKPTAALTFFLVKKMLAPLLPGLTTDATTLILSTDRFAVQVAEVCSGLEGVGLILAFSVAWLLYFRRDYIFPRALVLIPIGVVAIFALNAVRIAALMLIGYAGFPEVAIYGFHSQAGWIAFLAVACGLVLLSRRSAWLNRAAIPDSAETYNPTAVYLMPLLAVLGAGTLSRALSSDFEYFYLLRVIAGGALLLWYRKKLAVIDWRASWRGAAVGVAVFLLWIVAAHFLLPPSPAPAKLAAMPTPLQLAWLCGRILGAVIIVPIAEELAYRGYLMRRLIDADFETVPYAAVHWVAILASAVLFGLAHGALWAPGILAGVAFGLLLVRSERLGEAVLAHATANALIAVLVLTRGQWALW